jgi:branched-subunit amino acid transport protein
MEKKVTIILLCFSIIVAFFNILIGEFQYILCIIPFFIAKIIKTKYSIPINLIGLIIIALYIIGFQNYYVGIIIMNLSSIMYYCIYYERNKMVEYVCGTSVLIFIVSYLFTNYTKSILSHAIVDTLGYITYSMITTLVIKSVIDEYKKTISELDELARVAVTELRRES